MLFRKKPVLVQAHQWFKDGDYPIDGVVKQYKTAKHFKEEPCLYCNGNMSRHGWITTLEGGHIVCPGDWIITGVKEEHYPCKPDIFIAIYDAVTWESEDTIVDMHDMNMYK